MLKTDGDLMENTKQTNHLPTCELKHQAMDESGLATYENAYWTLSAEQEAQETTHYWKGKLTNKNGWQCEAAFA